MRSALSTSRGDCELAGPVSAREEIKLALHRLNLGDVDMKEADRVSLDAVIEMAAALRGSQEALREKPYFLHLVTPLPVNLARIHSEQIIIAARAGIPVGVGTLPIGGASSPITLAGCITQALMTDFATVIPGQLAAEGSFCVGCSDVNFMEPATGAIGSFSQTPVADMAMCQVRGALGFPSLTGTGNFFAHQHMVGNCLFQV